jgi:hypothetical protein
VAALAGAIAACGTPASLEAAQGKASESGGVVSDWVSIVEAAVHNPSTPRGPASAILLHTVAHLAVYDAVVAIEGGYKPYGATIAASNEADVRAAVATAAYRAARERVADSQFAYLDERYAGYMSQIPEGEAKAEGVKAGEAAAYKSIDEVMKDVSDARVWGGLHYRNSMEEGNALGHRVADHVTQNYFLAV